MRSLWKLAAVHFLIIAFVILSMNSNSLLFSEARISNFLANQESTTHRRFNREGPGYANPSPAANVNDHQHH